VSTPHSAQAADAGRPRLSFALPKGRLEEQVKEHLASRGIKVDFKDRKLVAHDDQGIFEFMLVKNVDLPTYVHHGIAGLGVCGEDVLYESGYDFLRLLHMPFGGTRICLAARNEVAEAIKAHHDWKAAVSNGGLRVASKFTRFTRDYFHRLGIPVDLIKLNGSVELAPVLGLAPFIVDLVETGSTLKANNLQVVQVLSEIKVHLVANPAYYKFHYRHIEEVLARIG
jgi:ATP phosphoribosyltransferase